MSATRADVICTLGMHRSGTSLVSRLLNLAGVRLGPDSRVLTSSEHNPQGYWEHRPIVDVNDEILARWHGSWDEPPAFPADWLNDGRLNDLKARARRIVADDFADAPLWGWKDPRTCLTLPFWQDVIGPMRYVICLRNPSAVASSLARRDGMPVHRADRLWLVYMNALLTHTRDRPHIVINYEDIIDDWPAELRRLATFVGHPDRADDPAVHALAGNFVQQEMCHHRPSADDLHADAGISFPAKAIYFALRGQSLDLVSAQALDVFDQTDALALEQTRLTAQLGTTIWERDDYQRQLQEILGSRAWRLVTWARKVSRR